MPVALQRQQTLREAFAKCVADEVAAVLAQDFGYVLVRIPAECAPNELVHVIVGAFGVTDEPDGVRLEETKDARLFDGPRIDAFAAFRSAECAPNELVHVIVGAFGVTDEPDGVRLEETKDARLFDGPRIDAFAAFGKR